MRDDHILRVYEIPYGVLAYAAHMPYAIRVENIVFGHASCLSETHNTSWQPSSKLPCSPKKALKSRALNPKSQLLYLNPAR